MTDCLYTANRFDLSPNCLERLNCFEKRQTILKAAKLFQRLLDFSEHSCNVQSIAEIPESQCKIKKSQFMCLKENRYDDLITAELLSRSMGSNSNNANTLKNATLAQKRPSNFSRNAKLNSLTIL